MRNPAWPGRQAWYWLPASCTAPVAPEAVMPAASQMPRVAPAASVKLPAPVRAWQLVLRLPPACVSAAVGVMAWAEAVEEVRLCCLNIERRPKARLTPPPQPGPGVAWA